MNHEKKTRLKKRYTVTLSDIELRRLSAYAQQSGIDRPTALHRIVSQSLRQVVLSADNKHDANQLGLFDSLQIDIFNNAAVVNNKE